MRRIIFGTIWLTGFLAVLLAWGMMWGRAQGEGPSRMIARKYDGAYSCQTGITMPELLHWWQPIVGEYSPCWILGWSADNHWLFYTSRGKGDRTEINNYIIGRIDASFRYNEILVGKTSGFVYLSPHSSKLVFSVLSHDAKGNTLLNWSSITMDGKNRQNLTNKFRLITGNVFYTGEPIISPSGDWIIANGPHTYTSYGRLYRFATDGHAVEGITNLPSQQSLVVLWSDAPEWLVLRNNHNLYRIRPDGSGLTRLTASEKGIYDTGWAHHSGVIGLIEGDLFSALWVDTNEILWQLKGVQEVLIGKEVGNPTYLDENWLYFRMTDGRYARCRLDGSSLTYYVSPNFPILSVRGWSSDGQWLWFETSATDPNKVDAMRVQADTGKVELMVDEMTPAASLTWTPDNRWAYYYDSDRQHVVRIRLDDNRQSEIVSNNAVPYSWTPPYQAEWQPTHTLTIGIGLMSFSTLTLIVLWRRRHKPRTT